MPLVTSLCYDLSMQDLEKSRQHVDLKLHPDVANSGVTVISEDEHHRQISAELKTTHPEAGVSKDATPPITQPTPDFIQLKDSKQIGNPLKDTSWGAVSMARRIFEQSKKKGDLQNAA